MDPANPYAAPQVPTAQVTTVGAADKAWRSGHLLIVEANAVLPDRCIKCNAPADGYRKRVQLSWHSPLAFLGLLGGLLPYIIIAVILTRKLHVQVGVCRTHVRKRQQAFLMTFLGAILTLFLVGLALSDAVQGAFGLLLLAALVVAIATLIYGIVATRLVWPKRIENQVAWVKGAGPEYLQALPAVNPVMSGFAAQTGQSITR